LRRFLGISGLDVDVLESTRLTPTGNIDVKAAFSGSDRLKESRWGKETLLLSSMLGAARQPPLEN
jgi:hypothetical protein